VARLAGVPLAVIRAARKRLSELERAARTPSPQMDLFAERPASSSPASTAEAGPELPEWALSLKEELLPIVPDQLTPRQALDLIYRLRNILPEGGES
jgi:DNA mismatch repair protein MutS